MNPNGMESVFLFLAILGAITASVIWLLPNKKPPSHKPR